jgi:hyperosmotically inducible protein
MKRLLAVMVLVGALTACRPAPQREMYAAGNSGKNVRDRSDAAVTCDDQANTRSEMHIARAIREAVMADAALSTIAHNLTIIAARGIVTLRGPVKSGEEKANIGAKARQVAGVTSVSNQIEIASD